LTRALAAELGSKHIRVNAVAPGATRVGTQASDEDGVARTVANTPMGRMGEPQDIARVALFLASPAAAWVTGQVIEASGGWGLSG
jgi:3-oxoacyl-[acyl-carrier protein] reductase